MDGVILPDGAEWDIPPGEMHSRCRCIDVYIPSTGVSGLLLLAAARDEEDKAQPAASRPYQGGLSERELMGFGELSEAEYDELVETEAW